MRAARFRILGPDGKTVGIAPTAADAVNMGVRLNNATILGWMQMPSGWQWLPLGKVVDGQVVSATE